MVWSDGPYSDEGVKEGATIGCMIYCIRAEFIVVSNPPFGIKSVFYLGGISFLWTYLSWFIVGKAVIYSSAFFKAFLYCLILL